MPLYRICEGLQRHGLLISRKLLSQWVIHLTMTLEKTDVMTMRLISSSGYQGNMHSDKYGGYEKLGQKPILQVDDIPHSVTNLDLGVEKCEKIMS